MLWLEINDDLQSMTEITFMGLCPSLISKFMSFFQLLSEIMITHQLTSCASEKLQLVFLMIDLNQITREMFRNKNIFHMLKNTHGENSQLVECHNRVHSLE